MRLFKGIAWALTGLLLSTSLAACGTTGAEPPAPEPIVIVREVKDTPPAELLRCPPAPAGLPASGEAVIPPAWRTGIIGLAKAYRQSADQLSRLIQFHTGAPCAPAGD